MLAGSKDSRFNFTDVGSLTLGSDAETVAILRRKGVIVVDETLAARINDGKTIKAHDPSEVRFGHLRIPLRIPFMELTRSKQGPLRTRSENPGIANAAHADQLHDSC